MRTVRYIRVSTTDQNEDRQRVKGVKSYVDKISGSIEFRKRPAALKLEIDIVNSHQQTVPSKRITTISVDSISRLGRNTIDILNTVNGFTDMGVCIEAEKEGIKTLIDGKENPTAKMVLSILATLSEYERELILERQREGIRAAKKRGVYENGGRPTLSKQDFIIKPKNAKCMKLLMEGRSIREAAALSNVYNGTAQKVKKIAGELQFLNDNYTPNELEIEQSRGFPL